MQHNYFNSYLNYSPNPYSNPNDLWSLPQTFAPHFSSYSPKNKDSYLSPSSFPDYQEPTIPIIPTDAQNDENLSQSSSDCMSDAAVSPQKADSLPPDFSSTQDTLSDMGKGMDLEADNSDGELYSKPKLRAVSHGLPNLGNTCYMNCVLQCLMNTQVVSDYFINRQHYNVGKPSALILSESFRHMAFSAFLKMVNPTQHITDDLRKLKIAVEKVAPMFKGYEQHDAHEFFRLFMQKLHDELNDAPRKGQPYKEFKPSKSDLTLPIMAEEWRKYSQERDHSVVNEVFGGQVLNEVICDSCGHVSSTFEDTLDFSLNLASEHDASSSIPDNIPNLYSCLKDFVKSEVLDGYKCSKCKQENSVKRTMIWKQPELLVIQLKRFVYDMYGNRQTVKEKISFPVEGLTLEEFMHEKSTEERAEYRLYAVVNHFGGLEFGHYISYVYNESQKCWFEYNDSQVTRMSTEEIEKFAEGSPYPYILFYKKI